MLLDDGVRLCELWVLRLEIFTELQSDRDAPGKHRPRQNIGPDNVESTR